MKNNSDLIFSPIHIFLADLFRSLLVFTLTYFKCCCTLKFICAKIRPINCVSSRSTTFYLCHIRMRREDNVVKWSYLKKIRAFAVFDQWDSDVLRCVQFKQGLHRNVFNGKWRAPHDRFFKKLLNNLKTTLLRRKTTKYYILNINILQKGVHFFQASGAVLPFLASLEQKRNTFLQKLKGWI